jgi:hypothetical protein
MVCALVASVCSPHEAPASTTKVPIDAKLNDEPFPSATLPLSVLLQLNVPLVLVANSIVVVAAGDAFS